MRDLRGMIIMNTGYLTEDEIDRFLDQFKIGGFDECWLWRSGVNVVGEGTIKIKGMTKSAHRISFELFEKKIPEGLFVVHSGCHNRHCVNPHHLILGDSRTSYYYRKDNHNLSKDDLHCMDIRIESVGDYSKIAKVYKVSYNYVLKRRNKLLKEKSFQSINQLIQEGKMTE